MNDNTDTTQTVETTQAPVDVLTSAPAEQAQENLAEKLTAAGKKAVAEEKKRQARVVKGGHLVDPFLKLASEAGLKLLEQSAFVKITGPVKGRTIYVARKGGRVDLSGFSVQTDAVQQISKEEAREKHLGNVRGTLDLDKSDDLLLETFKLAVKTMLEAPAADASKS